MRIEDGGGSNGAVKVDYKQRLDVHATTREEEELSILEGRGVQVNSGWISSLADGESALLYAKNNEGGFISGLPQDFHFTRIFVGLGISSNFNGRAELIVYRNPTGGTIVSGATAVTTKSNQNFGSNEPFDDLLIYEGSNGLTLTGGTEHARFALSTSTTQATRFAVGVNWIMPRGASIGMSIDPDISSGTVEAYVGIVGFYVPRDFG